MKRIIAFSAMMILCLSLILFLPAFAEETTLVKTGSAEIGQTETGEAAEKKIPDDLTIFGHDWDPYKLRADLTAGGDYEDLWVYELEGNVYAFADLLHNEEDICFLILGEERALMLDTGLGIYDLYTMARKITDLPLTVVVSHEHFDHIGGNMYFDGVLCFNEPKVIKALTEGQSHEDFVKNGVLEYFYGKLPSYVDPDTLRTPGRAPVGLLEEGDMIDLGGRTLEVMNVKGHADSSIVLYDQENSIMFPGDMFYPGPLLVFGDSETGMQVYSDSLKKMLRRAEELHITHVYGSHNCVQEGLEDLRKIIRFTEDIIAGKVEAESSEKYGLPILLYTYEPDDRYEIWHIFQGLQTLTEEEKTEEKEIEKEIEMTESAEAEEEPEKK